MDRSKSMGEESEQEEGMAEKVVSRVKRAAGAVQRAARGALGRPEAGDDLLFQVLHADHEEVAQLFEKVLAAPEGDRLIDLWGQLSINLTAHNLAETEVVYGCLSALAPTRDQIPHSIEEHNEVDRMLAEADAVAPGTDEFFALVTEIQQAVLHHVDQEEGTLLPNARSALSEEARDALVAQFRKRKFELMPEVEEELDPVLEQERKALQSGDLDDADDDLVEEDADLGGDVRRGDAPSSDRDRAAAKPSRATARASGNLGSRGKPAGGDLDQRTLKELQEMARSQGIEGRSKMSKPELLRALRRR